MQLLAWLLVPTGLVIGLTAQGPKADSPPPSAEESAQIVNRLIASWKAQRSEVVTAEVRAKIYRYFDRDSKTIQRGQILKWIERLNGTFDAAAADHLKDMMPNRNPDSFYWGQDFLIYVDGVRVLNRIKTGAGFEQIASFNGVDEVRYNGLNSEATVSTRTPVELIDFEDIRTVPWLDERVVPSHYTLGRLSDGVATLTVKGGTEIVAEVESGYIVRLAGKSAPDRSQEIFQIGKLANANSAAPIPQAVVKVSWQGDWVRMLTVLAVQKVVINEERTNSDFAVAAPAGTRLADLRQGPKAPLGPPLVAPVNDVLAYLNSKKAPVLTTDAGWGWTLWGLFGVAVGSLLVGNWLWRNGYTPRVAG